MIRLALVSLFAVAFSFSSAQAQQVDSLINSAMGDLNAAKSSAGSAANPATGSRLRLTKMRLDSAAQKLDQAESALGDAAGDHAPLAEARKLHAELSAIIAPKPETPEEKPEPDQSTDPKPGDTAPEPKPEPNPDSPPAEEEKPAFEPLTGEQKQLKRKLDWDARQAKYWAGQATGRLKAIEQKGPPILYANAVTARNELTQAQGEFAKVVEHYKQVPFGHPELEAANKDTKAAQEMIKEAIAKYNELAQPLQGIDQLEADKDFPADFDRVTDFRQRYRNFAPQAHDMGSTIITVKEDAQAMEEVKRIEAKYLQLLTHQSPNGQKLGNQLKQLAADRAAYVEAAKAYAKQIPGEIDGHLADIRKMADQAVADEKPAFFGPDGGINQQMGWAESKADLLAAMVPEAGKAEQEKIAQAKQQLAGDAAKLRDTIIQNNKPPVDRFGGDDRDAVIAKATEKLKEQWPDVEILKAVIVSENWTRRTAWELTGRTWYKIDSSGVQVQFVVKHTDELAAIRPINVRKNHLSNDTLKAYAFDEVGEEVPPHRLMPLAKVGQ